MLLLREHSRPSNHHLAQGRQCEGSVRCGRWMRHAPPEPATTSAEQSEDERDRPVQPPLGLPFIPGEGRHRLDQEDRRQRPGGEPNHALGHDRLFPQADPRQDDQHRGDEQQHDHGGHNAHARRRVSPLDPPAPRCRPASSRHACRPGQPPDRLSRETRQPGPALSRLPLSVPSHTSPAAWAEEPPVDHAAYRYRRTVSPGPLPGRLRIRSGRLRIRFHADQPALAGLHEEAR